MMLSCSAMRLAASALRRRRSSSSGGAAIVERMRHQPSPSPSTSSSSSSSSSLLLRFRSTTIAASASSSSSYDPIWPPPGKDPRLVVLGIESSCDDTGVAVVRGDGVVLGQALTSQSEIHAPFGGVVPKLAADAHRVAIDATVERALAEAGLKIEDVDAVAVTSGPGLSLCLRVGGGKAAALAREAGVPLVQVHHLEAHALVARLGGSGQGGGGGESFLPPFPFVCVLASGGHNLLLLVRGVGDYSILGTTLDDALGEAFDKVARMLALDPTPSGGAAVERAAAGRFTVDAGSSSSPPSSSLSLPGDPKAFGFARPLKGNRKQRGANVSYAGLKTAVRMAAERTLPELLERVAEEADGEGDKESSSSPPPPPPSSSLSLLQKAQSDLAASFQRVAVEHLAEKTVLGLRLALEKEPLCSALVLTGGVARNVLLRSEMEKVAAEANLPLVAPPPNLCTDNGVMVAWAALERLSAGVARLPRPEGMPDPAPEGWVDCRPRWPLAVETAAFVEELGSSARWMKSARLHQSLTELTQEVLRESREGERGEGGGERPSSSSSLKEVAL